MVKLVRFANELDEYVVIVTEDIDLDEHKEPGYVLVGEVELDIDPRTVSMFPTDRPLRADD